jgi:uncharacterized protein (DUF2267 family)
MSNVQWRKLNWVTKQSPWDVAQAWRAKRQAQADFFESQTGEALTRIANAQTGQINGSVEIALRVAVGRIQTQAKAKVAAAVKVLNKTA